MTTRYEGTAAEIAAAIIARSLATVSARLAAEDNLVGMEPQPPTSGKFCNRTPPTWSGTPKPVAPTVAEVLAVPAEKPPRRNDAKSGGRQRSFAIPAAECKHQNGFRRAGNGRACRPRFQCRLCGKRIADPVAKGWRIAE